MKRIGKVLHITPSGKAISTADNPPKIGSTVLSKNKKKVGTISDIFGPTNSPYISVDLNDKTNKKIVGTFLYYQSSSKRKKRKESLK